jgi:hypothetical protein
MESGSTNLPLEPINYPSLREQNEQSTFQDNLYDHFTSMVLGSGILDEIWQFSQLDVYHNGSWINRFPLWSTKKINFLREYA